MAYHCLRVENILNGLSEQSKILYSDKDFLILPDMKWDLKTISSLYLVAIVQDRGIRSLRDLQKSHLPLLNAIRTQAIKVASHRWGVGEDSLRLYVHYQPSYCGLYVPSGIPHSHNPKIISMYTS